MGNHAASLLTIRQAAQELALSVFTVRAWVGQRRLGAVRLGRAVRIRRSEIDRLIEQGTVPAQRASAR